MRKIFSLLLMQGVAAVAIAGAPAAADRANVKVYEAPEVISTEALGSELRLQVVKLPDGTLRKRVVSAFGSSQQPAVEISPKSVIRAEATAQGVPFHENFESWDGKTYDWIPEGWTDVSKVDPPNVAPEDHGINPTWQVESPSWDVSIDGKYFARIANHYYSDKETGALVNKPQDEWLITPTVRLEEDNWLYFYLCYHPGWVFFNSQNYTFTSLNNVMQVQISDDGGATWTMLWSCLEDAQKYTQRELMNSLASLTGTWIPVRVPLTDYAGKDVKVAFRYVGINGESMVIDAVSIKKPEPQAYYTIPIGSFYSGFDVNQTLPEKSSLLCGPFKPITFYNVSNIDCETFKWEYVDEDGNKAETDAEDLSVTYEPGEYDVPSLTGTAGTNATSTYAIDCDFIRAGGSNAVTTAEGKVEYGACNYNTKKGVGYYNVSGSFLFGTGSDSFWTSYINMDNVKVKLTAICNYFPAPNHSYCFDKVWVSAIAFAKPEAMFSLEIRRVLGNGTIESTPIAVADCRGSDLINTTRDGIIYATLPFDLGRYVTVDTGLFMKLTGFTDAQNVSEFAALSQLVPNADGTNYAYIYLTGYLGDQTDDLLIPASHINSSAGVLNTAMCFNMNANFTWIECNDPYFYAAEQKQSKGLKFYTQFRAEDFTITGDGVGDWITYKFGTYNEETSQQLLTLTVAENTGHNRQSDVSVSVPGSTCVVQVMQDGPLGGVAAVKITKSARFEGENLVLTGAGGTTVAVYNAMGVKLAEQAVEGDNAVVGVPAAASSGLYVLKFSDGTAVKVIR